MASECEQEPVGGEGEGEGREEVRTQEREGEGKRTHVHTDIYKIATLPRLSVGGTSASVYSTIVIARESQYIINDSTEPRAIVTIRHCKKL